MTNTTITSLYPRLVVSDGPAAIDFYRAALGAEELVRHTGAGGKIVHAELRLGNAIVFLKEEGDGDPSPTSLGGTAVIMALGVDDVDAVAAAMTRAGATVVYPVADRPYGERDGRFADPFGHLWLVSQRRPDLASQDVRHRAGRAD